MIAMKKSKLDKFWEDWENYINEWLEEQEEEIYANKFGQPKSEGSNA